jgi:hypothetical protein
MLSGRPPFVAESAMTLMMMHLNDPIPNVRGFREDVPAELVHILEKLLAKDRRDRYQSAAELTVDLRRVLANLKQPAPVVPPPVSQDRTVISKMDPALSAGRTTGPQPIVTPSNTSSVRAPVSSSSTRPLLFAGIGLVAVACLVVAALAGRFIFRQMNAAPPIPTQTIALATDTQPVTEAPVVIVAATETLAGSTDTPTIEPTVTETMPPLYVRINSITVDGSGHYVVDYETFGYTEQLPGMHVHFFFNTVSVEQAGSPGSGPWYLYGGPRPFTKYRESDRPADATEMCALVANSNHSIIPGSGNCVNLP